jgi:hypothetical protein
VVISGLTGDRRGDRDFFLQHWHIPQDLKSAGEQTRPTVGARNGIREGVTDELGTMEAGYARRRRLFHS